MKISDIPNSRKCAFIPVDNKHFYPEGTHIAIQSFKRFHPDIDLILFRPDITDKLFKEKKIDWYNAKPFLAELLENKYDLICNLDADHIILDRLSLIFDEGEWDILGPHNLNDYENASFENITEEMYIQGGMWATTSHKFLRIWREKNVNARKYLRRENDIMNLVIYNDLPNLKLKIVDRDRDYYGCKSLGREPEFYVENGKTYCRGEQVVAYHFARGGVFPKLDIPNMPLKDEVKELWSKIAFEGISMKMTSI